MSHPDKGLLFSEATVFPEQFYMDPPGNIHKTRGEVALLCAILEDALVCFQKQFVIKNRCIRRIAREAEEWFFTDDDRWPFSFVNICAVLRLNPQSIRMRLQHWSQNPSSAQYTKKRRFARRRQSLQIAA